MSKPTPGPWKISHGGFGTDDGFSIASNSIEAKNVKQVAECWPCAIVNDDHRRELAANARLIAAAPQLLAALKAVEWEGWAPREDDYCCPSCRNPKYTKHHPNCQLHAAIRAAEGTEL